MKFSSTPFVLLASVLAVATALPTDGDYNGGAIQDNSAAVTARDVQAYSDGYVPTDSVVNATSIEARGSGSAAAEDILTLGIKAAIEGFIHLADQIKQDKVVRLSPPFSAQTFSPSDCSLINEIMQDRSEFTQRVVGDLSAKDPSLNYVICHTKHEYNWDGVQGQDWSHSHQEFDIQIGGTIG